MNQPTVKQLFDAAASEYDKQRKSLIPCFDDFYGMALSLVDSGESAPRILDLGAGTGLFSGMVKLKYPQARMTLIDLSDAMLEGARRRFQHAEDVQYIVADYSTYEFTESYDYVISSLSIHHLPHSSKQQLFRTIHRILRDGGVFVNADQVQGYCESTDAMYRKRWLEQIAATSLSQAEINASIERRKVDINAKLGDQLRWMEDAGFAEVDCMYKSLDFGVFYGRKAESSNRV
ncbi:class I SAM-dependent methyltransferase [Paenibacillus cremeus]|uniref:Class I SAM-dependent methyltransferase n=1 Tax=Paenibacillus cremeus TaxID=2163881 RepID=A0A559JKC5_9BACL|nr:class I SAM-dependent methyltransferase [Paenibacillus cremeus]TVY00341.1 class I SAM-dependent methyltransferase [Paenibacillus cremeus]